MCLNTGRVTLNWGEIGVSLSRKLGCNISMNVSCLTDNNRGSPVTLDCTEAGWHLLFSCSGGCGASNESKYSIHRIFFYQFNDFDIQTMNVCLRKYQDFCILLALKQRFTLYRKS